MDQNQNPSLFGLSVDQIGRAHLTEAARWAKFLAIVGFVICALMILGSVFITSILTVMNRQEGFNSRSLNSDEMAGFGGFIVVSNILFTLLFFFPCLYLYYFATKMKTALLSNDQNILNTSFQNLKKTLRFVGIVMIVLLSIYALIIVVAILGAAASQI